MEILRFSIVSVVYYTWSEARFDEFLPRQMLKLRTPWCKFECLDEYRQILLNLAMLRENFTENLSFAWFGYKSPLFL